MTFFFFLVSEEGPRIWPARLVCLTKKRGGACFPLPVRYLTVPGTGKQKKDGEEGRRLWLLPLLRGCRPLGVSWGCLGPLAAEANGVSGAGRLGRDTTGGRAEAWPGGIRGVSRPGTPTERHAPFVKLSSRGLPLLRQQSDWMRELHRSGPSFGTRAPGRVLVSKRKKKDGTYPSVKGHPGQGKGSASRGHRLGRTPAGPRTRETPARPSIPRPSRSTITSTDRNYLSCFCFCCTRPHTNTTEHPPAHPHLSQRATPSSRPLDIVFLFLPSRVEPKARPCFPRHQPSTLDLPRPTSERHTNPISVRQDIRENDRPHTTTGTRSRQRTTSTVVCRSPAVLPTAHTSSSPPLPPRPLAVDHVSFALLSTRQDSSCHSYSRPARLSFDLTIHEPGTCMP